MITESQIRDKVNELLARKIEIDSFEDWLVTASWNMHRDSDEVAQRLASAIELRLSEFSSGHLAEARLRTELRELLPTNSGIIFVSPVNLLESPRVSTGSSIWLESPLMPLRPLQPAGI
jgi:hypothetical protein